MSLPKAIGMMAEQVPGKLALEEDFVAAAVEVMAVSEAMDMA